LTAALISATASCDRGAKEHLNGSGVLHEKNNSYQSIHDKGGQNGQYGPD
jgi:hypothetical protein